MMKKTMIAILGAITACALLAGCGADTSELSTLQEQVNSQAASIDTLSSVSQDLTDLQETVTVQTQRIDALSATVTSQTGTITEMQTTIDAQAALIEEMQTTIDAQASQLAAVEDLLSGSGTDPDTGLYVPFSGSSN